MCKFHKGETVKVIRGKEYIVGMHGRVEGITYEGNPDEDTENMYQVKIPSLGMFEIPESALTNEGLFNEGDRVVVVSGKYKGIHGTVKESRPVKLAEE